MPNVDMLLYTLMGFMIVGSLVAVETSDLLSSVICIGAVGFALGIVHLLLRAPELALTLGVVEVLTLVVLIRVVRTRRDSYHATSHDTLSIAVVIGGLGVLLTLAYFALDGLPRFGEPKMLMATPYLEQAYAKTHLSNAVTAVLLNFRAYDTLAVTAVLFAAVTGAFTILRRWGRRR
jgi:multicomponent Na+:H+ antiporter subunit B